MLLCSLQMDLLEGRRRGPSPRSINSCWRPYLSKIYPRTVRILIKWDIGREMALARGA